MTSRISTQHSEQPEQDGQIEQSSTPKPVVPDHVTTLSKVGNQGEKTPKPGRIKLSKKVIICIIAGAVLVGAGSVGGAILYGTRHKAASHFGATGKPLTVTPTLAPTSADILLSTEANSQSVDGAAGTFSIDSDKNAVLGNHSIKTTEITALAGVPSSIKLLGGLQFEPDGKRLAGPLTMSLPLPDGTDAKKVFGFAYGANGANFHLEQATVTNGVATMDILGFSGHGYIYVGDSSQLTFGMSKPEDAANTAAIKAITEGGKDSPQLHKILVDWFYLIIKPQLLAASGKTDSSVDEAVSAFDRWQYKFKGIGQADEDYPRTFNEAFDLAAETISKSIEAAGAACKSQKDPGMIALMMRWNAIGVRLGLEDRNKGYSQERASDLMTKCSHFKLTMTSTIGYTVSDGSTVEAKAKGDAELLSEGSLYLEGKGKFEENSYTVGGQECARNMPFVYQVSVLPTEVEADPNLKKVDIPILLSSLDGNPAYTCKGGNTSFRVGGDDAWRTTFDIMHDAERTSRQDDGDAYMLSNWDIVNTGGVYARKIYSRTITKDTLLLTEKTTFELIYNP